MPTINTPPKLLITFGISLYEDEREFVAKVANIYGMSLAAATRWIINDYRRLKQELEGGAE